LLSIAAVAAGGSVGATVRYLTVVAGIRIFGTKFPIGTVVVNLVGCLIAGLLVGLLERSLRLSHTAQLAVFTGFLGGLTTLSAFSVETFSFIRDGSWGIALLHITLNAVLGIAMVAAGVAVSRLA
jgi:fluoride exporter